jgi:hypothetical protein
VLGPSDQPTSTPPELRAAPGARRCCLWDGWPSRDRAVDAPAVQDVPAWDGFVAWLFEGVVKTAWSPGESELCRVPLTLLRAKQRDVDLIAHGQLSPQRVDRRYAAFWKHPLLGCGRSTAVSTEGADSSPMDWGSAPEACEIGGLGTLCAVLRDGPSERASGLAVPAAGGTT